MMGSKAGGVLAGVIERTLAALTATIVVVVSTEEGHIVEAELVL